MRFVRRFLLLACAVAACACAAQPPSARSIAEGKALFRGNCAFCHGLTGAGGRGPSLISGRFLHGGADEDIKNVVRNGVPGTTMPAFESMARTELSSLVAFIRTLSGSSKPNEPVPGDPAHGRQVYARNGCAACHRIGGEGSVFGPELTRVGAGRSVEYLRQSIVNPSADIPPEYEGVTVVTRDRGRIRGVRVNEDTFTVQLRDPSQQFRMYRKSDLQEVVHETASIMPAYKLSKPDLDGLVAYLTTLRGELKAGSGVRKSKGIQ